MHGGMCLFAQGRSSCASAAKLCPGISIGCGFCAIVSPDTCGIVCPVAGIYCGVAGYACEDEEEETTNTEEEEEEEM